MAWLTPPPGRSCATNSCGWRPLQATTGLVSSMLPFGESEDRLWAKELLSSSFLGAQAYSDPQLDPPPAPPHEDWDNPVAALHCAGPTVPGTTGTRPEHITDLLNVPRWVHATKVHAALTILVWRLSAGFAPSRWLTRARICLNQHLRASERSSGLFATKRRTHGPIGHQRTQSAESR